MHMLSDNDPVATVAVKDLGVARRFYSDTLELPLLDSESNEVLVFKSGRTKLNVYRSKYAGTNQATAITWPVGDQLEDTVRRLKDKGVRFEHYDMPGLERKGDLHVHGDMQTAWFKDPDGNILNVINR